LYTLLIKLCDKFFYLLSPYESTMIRPVVMFILYEVYTGFIQQKLCWPDSPVTHSFSVYIQQSAEILLWGFTLQFIRNILGAFAKLYKQSSSFSCLSICLFIRMQQLDSCWTDFQFG